MKKLLLLLTAGLVITSANAQNMKNDPAYCNSKKDRVVNTTTQQGTLPAHHTGARTTTTTFYTEDFHTGTYTTMPTGWTTGVITGPGAWHWANTASSSTYSLGTLASTTGANGWMIFDSDSLGTA